MICITNLEPILQSPARQVPTRVKLSGAKHLLLRVGAWLLLALATASFGTIAHAQDVSGTVTNGTSSKPQAGADVALVDPMQGMAELATAKSDSKGRFTLKVASAAQGPRLVRVGHEGINYFKMVPPGTNNVQVNIYDVAKKLDGINGVARVMRMQTSSDGGTLQVTELHAVNNSSTPPRTLAADNSFEITVPEGAKIDGADAQGPNGQPLPVQPNPVSGKKDTYSFSYALKPGETRFQIAYHLPYSGSVNISARMLRSYQHFAVLVPQSMKWEPKSPAAFSPMTDQPGTTVQVASQVKAGDELAFRVSGTGSIVDQQDASADNSGSGMQASGGGQSRGPGGGIGAPIESPDALERYRWIILGMLGVMLVGGAYLTVSRAGNQQQQVAAASESATANAVATPVVPVVAPQSMSPAAAPSPTNSSLLDAMKEELFALELDRQNGQISDDEYQKQKAALDQTLARAIARQRIRT